MDESVIRELVDSDRAWAAGVLCEHWGSPQIVTRGVVHEADRLHGLVAWRGGERVGLATYRIDALRCELVSLNALLEKQGLGTALLSAVTQAARAAGCRRLWLVTTNDNTAALRFYQKRGFRIVAVHRNALAESRRLKPEMPLIGSDGIPLCDEIELESMLDQPP